MNRLESELFDLEELLMRNDGMADDGTYSTIVGIANDVSELEEENVKLRELVNQMYRDMQGVIDMSGDTVWVDAIGTLRDKMDHHMQDMSALGIPPMDYEHRMRELGIEES